MALISLQELKTYAGITTDENDAQLKQIIQHVSSYFESRTGQDFSVQSRSEKVMRHDGRGLLRTRYAPIISLDEILFNGAALDLDDITYDEKTGTIWLWRDGSGTETVWTGDFQISYTSGFLTIPKDVKLAACELVTQMSENAGASGLQSARMGEYSYTRFRESVEHGTSPFFESVVNLYRLVN